MQLQDAITLLQHASYSALTPATWADLGCGTGLFTHALASLQQPGSQIFAVDTNRTSLGKVVGYKDITIQKIHQDFVREEWPFATADGILMANSLHYVQDKFAFLAKASRHLTETGCFLLVEYDTDTPNPWVPYPISFPSLKQLFRKAGYSTVEKGNKMPSMYGRANLYGAYISR